MISIIVPIYKVEPFLHQCIDSILNQNYNDLEILLIDDGSPDNCGKICDQYANCDGRIRTFHTDNRGLSAARNLGLKNAKGDYIGFVDSDDWIEPDMYGALLKRINETGADVCVCGYWMEDMESSVRTNHEERILNKAESLEALIDGTIESYVWNKLYRSVVINSNSFPEGKFYEDTVAICEVFNKCNSIALLGQPKYHYRQRTDSITKTYSASPLIDYATICIERCLYFKEEHKVLYENKYMAIVLSVALGILRLWRWWHGVDKEDKQKYKEKVRELKTFTKENIPLFGYPSWPLYVRISTLFMYSDSWLSFAVLYYLNQLYRRLKPEKV